MSDIEKTKPIDVLATRVWSGTHWHYPHIETMIAEIERLRADNATLLQPGGYEYFVKSRDDAESRAMRYHKAALHATEKLNEANAAIAQFRKLYELAYEECQAHRDYPEDDELGTGDVENENVNIIRMARLGAAMDAHDTARKENANGNA